MQPKSMDWQHLIEEFHGLVAGSRYQVCKSFVDAAGDEHNVGENWLLVGSMFSKFDDLVTLCVSLKDATRHELPLSWRRGEQDHVIESFSEYLSQAPLSSGA